MKYKWMPTVQGGTCIGIFICYLISGLVAIIWNRSAALLSEDVSNFDLQVRYLLKKEMLTRAEIANLSLVFDDLQETLQQLWPGSKVIPLGSFVTGLATISSDADCMVEVPNHDVTSDRHLVEEASRILRQQPNLYDQVRSKIHANRRIPLLKFKYVPTERNCDVNFISDIALRNSEMMAYYLNLDEKFLALAAILKFWSKVHRLRSTETVASNSLNLLVIFYLQQKYIVPPFSLLQKHLIKSPVNDWETRFKRLPYNLTITTSLYELLGGFFKYYSKFNFEEYVVSPLLGRPIRKREFEDVERLPKELFLYKNYMRKPGSKPLVLNTKLCVQDAIEQRRNTADVPEYKANMFISHVKLAAQIFDIVPSNRFLKALLSKSVIHYTQSCRNLGKVSEIKILKECVNATGFNYNTL